MKIKQDLITNLIHSSAEVKAIRSSGARVSHINTSNLIRGTG